MRGLFGYGTRAFKGLLLLLLAVGCSDPGRKPRHIAGDDSLTSGTIHISVDESFRPVIEAQLEVFHSQNPQARVIPHYKPEAECIKDLADDTTRLVIITRGLTESEEVYYEDTLQFRPAFGRVASDAVAVVVHIDDPDSLFTVAELRGMLSGAVRTGHRHVMDGLQATSTVRFLIDSVLRGQPLSGEVMAARTSEAVIDHVARNKGHIGYVGVSWIGNKEDSTQLSFLRKVRIAALQCAPCGEDVYVKPYQANIVLHRYPLTRGLYYVLKENYAGLGRGFVNFLKHEKGQKIFNRAYLAPEWTQLRIRTVNIKE